jgi:hypothetical protein
MGSKIENKQGWREILSSIPWTDHHGLAFLHQELGNGPGKECSPKLMSGQMTAQGRKIAKMKVLQIQISMLDSNEIA